MMSTMKTMINKMRRRKMRMSLMSRVRNVKVSNTSRMTTTVMMMMMMMMVTIMVVNKTRMVRRDK